MRSVHECLKGKDGRPLPTVEMVVPVLNEVKALEPCVLALRAFFAEEFPYPARILIAENGSTDGTIELARDLTQRYDGVRCIVLPKRGRGRALRLAWTESDADILAYTDVDLSTGLATLEPMCMAIHEEGYDVAIGSRLMPDSKVRRCWKREVISRMYNMFIKCVLFTHFSDAQCGFKAVSRRVVDTIVPLVKDEAWFFDTELLVLAEKLGWRIKDVPAKWDEDMDSRVKIISTAWEDIKGVFRLRWALWTRRLRPNTARPQPEAVPPAVGAALTAAPGEHGGRTARGPVGSRAGLLGYAGVVPEKGKV